MCCRCFPYALQRESTVWDTLFEVRNEPLHNSFLDYRRTNLTRICISRQSVSDSRFPGWDSQKPTESGKSVKSYETFFSFNLKDAYLPHCKVWGRYEIPSTQSTRENVKKFYRSSMHNISGISVNLTRLKPHITETSRSALSCSVMWAEFDPTLSVLTLSISQNCLSCAWSPIITSWRLLSFDSSWD